MKKSDLQRIVFLFATSGPVVLAAQHDTVRHHDTLALASTENITPLRDVTKVRGLPQTGEASWYGKVFEGRLTSSGERFHCDSLTCAHKTLPFGTVLKVTNLKNNSVVYVKVTDRLPKASWRVIDLTSGAAIQLGFLRAGITQVKLEYAGTAPIRDDRKKKAALTPVPK